LILVLMLAAAVVGTLLLAFFVHLEATDRRETIFAVVLVVFFFEMTVYGEATEVPIGLARIPFIGGEVRPPEILLPVAVLARILAARGLPRLTSWTACVWGAFIAWYVTAGAMGLMAGNPLQEVFYQGKAAITIGCGIVVASGLDPKRLVDRRRMGHWAYALGAVSAVSLFASVTGLSLHLSIPGLLPGMQIGAVDVDAQLILPMAGAIVAVVESCRPDRRPSVLIAATSMLIAPASSTQGAAFLGAGVVVLVLVVAALGQTWRRRVRITPTEVGLLIALLVAALTIGLIVEPDHPPIDITAQLHDTFASQDSYYTARARERLWRDAFGRVRENPVLGAGLGVRQTLHRETDRTLQLETTAHNIFLDTAVRAGIVGALMLALALGMTTRDALEAWRRRSRLQAALALGSLAAVAGFVANASVQSSFERFRNTTALGITAGLLLAVARSGTDEGSDEEDEDGEASAAPTPWTSGGVGRARTRTR
jgi:O-antigen ligase